MTYFAASVDSEGEILQSAFSMHESVQESVKRPDAAAVVTIPPEVEDSYWDFESSTWVARPEQPSRTHSWDRASKQWVDRRSLADRQDEAWARIKEARDETEFGSFVWDGSRFNANRVSVQRIQGAAQMALMSIGAGVARTFEWTLYDDTSRELTANEMVQVGLALGAHIDEAHRKARRLRRRIYAATTIAELDTITWNDPPTAVGQP